MKCKNAVILISAAADGEISERELRELNEHLVGCAECRQEQKLVSGLRRTLEVWEAPEPAPLLADAFAYRLRREREKQQRSWRERLLPVMPAFGLASAAAAVILVVVYFASMRPPDVVAPVPEQTAVVHPKVQPIIPKIPVVANLPKPVPVKVVLAKPGKPVAAVAKPVYRQKRWMAYIRFNPRYREAARRSLRPRQTMPTVPLIAVAIAPQMADGVRAVSDSAKIEAERRIAEKAARLKSLIAEANTKIEDAIIRPAPKPEESEPVASPT